MHNNIVILGGNIWLGKSNDLWQTQDVDGPGDAFGPTFCRLRVCAGFLVYRKFGGYIIASGGKGTQEKPSIAEVIRRELLEFDVKDESIILEERSTDTHSQLREVQALVVQQPEIGYTQIISNVWHLPRINAMIKHSPHLEKLRHSPLIVRDAETVLLENNFAAWEDTIEQSRLHPGMARRLANESQGVDDIIAGRYKFT